MTSREAVVVTICGGDTKWCMLRVDIKGDGGQLCNLINEWGGVLLVVSHYGNSGSFLDVKSEVL